MRKIMKKERILKFIFIKSKVINYYLNYQK